MRRITVDVRSNNSTADLRRQITDGISESDLDHHSGTLGFDENDEMFLNGDTEISIGSKNELASIMGDPRIIPIFDDFSGNGNNTMYRIVEYAGVRIMDVKLIGKISNKRVIIPSERMVFCGGIPSARSTPNGSLHVFACLTNSICELTCVNGRG